VSGPILHLTILQSPVFLINSRLDLFTAAPHCWGDLFSRSYESILPSSLAMNHSSALGFSPRLPVSVYGTGTYYLKLRGFSWKPLGTLSLCPKTPSTIAFTQNLRICLPILYYTSTNYSVSSRYFHSLRHPITVISSTGILTRWPSTSLSGSP
jgi:hypothetical protein